VPCTDSHPSSLASQSLGCLHCRSGVRHAAMPNSKPKAKKHARHTKNPHQDGLQSQCCPLTASPRPLCADPPWLTAHCPASKSSRAYSPPVSRTQHSHVQCESDRASSATLNNMQQWSHIHCARSNLHAEALGHRKSHGVTT